MLKLYDLIRIHVFLLSPRPTTIITPTSSFLSPSSFFPPLFSSLSLNEASLPCLQTLSSQATFRSALTFSPLQWLTQSALGSSGSWSPAFPGGCRAGKNHFGPPLVPFIFKWMNSDERECLRGGKEGSVEKEREIKWCLKGSGLYLHQQGE